MVAAPLRSGSGAALGSLYLKRAAAVEREAWQGDDLRDARAAAGVAAGLAAAFLWLLLPTWVFVDARGRGLRRAWLFAFLTALSAVVGLVVYLIARPEAPAALSCPGCGARGGRQLLVPALRPRPVGRLLRGLPLPAEARLGLLPGVPHRDPAPPGAAGARAARARAGRLGWTERLPDRPRLTGQLPEPRAARARCPCWEEPCPPSSTRRAPARRPSAARW